MKPADQIILKFLQGKGTSEEIKKLRGWSKSAVNKKELNDYSKLWLWSHQLKDRAPQVEFENTWQKITAEKTISATHNLWIKSIVKYAAVILIVLNIGWWGASLYYKNTEVDGNQQVQVSADHASNSVLTLPDNTLVYLREGSNLKYDPRFRGGQREVLLEGEAYFEVTSDKKHPFVVKTKNAHIKVLGTKFNVLAEKGSTICQTTLVEGKVEFIVPGRKNYMLLPNQMVELNSKSREVHIRKVNTELYTAWKDGKIIFRDETLGEIARELGKIYHVKFIFVNPDMAEKYRFSGTFNRETPLGDVITMLKLSIPMTVTRDEKFPDPDIIYLK